MAETKAVKTRIQSKHGLEKDWIQATNFRPLPGEIIVYEPQVTEASRKITGDVRKDEVLPVIKRPRFKVGNGTDVVTDLPFAEQEQVVKRGEGEYSTVSGQDTEAKGFAAHAEGYSTSSEGFGSHAEGAMTQAIAEASHTEGKGTVAAGIRGHAEGLETRAVGEDSHAEGIASFAIGKGAHAEGYKTNAGAPEFKITTFDDETKTYTSNIIPDLTYVGIDFTSENLCGYIKVKDYTQTPLLRYASLGQVELTRDLDSNTFSIKVIDEDKYISYENILKYASEVYFILEDRYFEIEGGESGDIPDIPEGELPIFALSELGSSAHTEGFKTYAYGGSAHAEGRYTVALDDFSHAEGVLTKAFGYASHAEGSETEASANYTHAEGANTKATEYFAHAEGYGTKATQAAAHAEGRGAIASNAAAHAEGEHTIASGFSAHSEGDMTRAAGGSAHSEGYNTKASGYAAHAEGSGTQASGNYSHAEGADTIALADFQHVQGRFNKQDDAQKYAHIVGNGTNENNRSNAHTVDWEGNGWFAGDVMSSDSTLVGISDAVLANIQFGSDLNNVRSKSIYVFGDSFMSELSSDRSVEQEHHMFKTFKSEYDLDITNYAVIGGCVANHSNRSILYQQIDEASAGSPDFVIFNGLINEVVNKNQVVEQGSSIYCGLGSLTEGFETPFESFDRNTFFGGLEYAAKRLKEKYPNAIKMYVTPHNASQKSPDGMLQLIDAARTVCKKWGIVFIDIYNYSEQNLSEVGLTLSESDFHPTQEGYDKCYIPFVHKTMSDIIDRFNKDDELSSLDKRVDTLESAKGERVTAGQKTGTKLGYRATAEGSDTTASNNYAHAEGSGTEASGNSSHAEGNNTHATGKCSHAEGQNSTASNDSAHAEGFNTTASGSVAHAEGKDTVASGNRSHAEGESTTAKGFTSHAEGQGTVAGSDRQHVQGRYNVEDTAGKYAHIVGGGWSGSPKNIHTVDWDGNAWFSGNIYVGNNSDRLTTEQELQFIRDGIFNKFDELLNKISELEQELTQIKARTSWKSFSSTPDIPEEPDIPVSNYAVYNNENLIHNNENVIIE